MTDERRKERLAAATKALDEVQAAVYAALKPHGFRKHGRMFHRFVEGDISQVVELQRGPAYLEQTHLFWVCVGIRVPECALRTFTPEENAKRFYREYECNLRWTVGEKSKKQTGAYDLRKPLEPIIEDILARLNTSVLPMFDMLSSRDAILEKRMAYPQLVMTHLFLLEKTMIYGRRGERTRAAEVFSAYFQQTDGDYRAYLRELAQKLGIDITD